jgi:hypothetical protein
VAINSPLKPLLFSGQVILRAGKYDITGVRTQNTRKNQSSNYCVTFFN